WRTPSAWSIFTCAFSLSHVFPKSNTFNPEAYPGWQRDSARSVDIVTGCFLLIQRGLWEKLGGFDERFFMYVEEADLCYRAKRVGARPMFTPEATIIHYGGKSERIKHEKLLKIFAAKATFVRKHWPKAKMRLGIILLESSVLNRYLGYAWLARAT